MLVKLDALKNEYNTFTEESGKYSEMMMDIGVYLFDDESENEKEVVFFEESKETAFLLLKGKAKISWNENCENIERTDLFNDKPVCLHVPKNTKVTITAEKLTEILIQKTTNIKEFEPVFYTKEKIKQYTLGENVWENTARRVIRDIFNYDNAPYSNMVLGELITLSGKWSSYPPHHHPQPEVYYHRFDKPQGFGCSLIGDDVYKITDGSMSIIDGGLCHPQAAAPGYAMYYCWMIRHFEDNPWTERINDPDHTWLLEKDPPIFNI